MRALLVQRLVLISFHPPPNTLTHIITGNCMYNKCLLVGVDNKWFAVYCNNNDGHHEAERNGDELKYVI